MRRLEREESRYVPRMTRAIAKALVSLRDRVSIEDLAVAVGLKRMDVIMSKISTLITDDSLTPSAAIVRDIVVAGGKAIEEEM